jgi:hypothetical protein
LLFFSINYILFLVEINPFSQIPFAGLAYDGTIVKQALKIFLPIIAIFDYNQNLMREFSILAALTLLFILYLRSCDPPSNNKEIYYLIIRT